MGARGARFGDSAERRHAAKKHDADAELLCRRDAGVDRAEHHMVSEAVFRRGRLAAAESAAARRARTADRAASHKLIGAPAA